MRKNSKNTIVVFTFLLLGCGAFLACIVSPQYFSTPRVGLTILLVNRAQNNLATEQKKPFAKTFDELAIDSLKGSNSYTSKEFHYIIDVRSPDVAVVGAKPLDRWQHGYNGATIKSKQGETAMVTSSIICKSKFAGADGTNLTHAPIAVDGGKLLRCASGWQDAAIE
jgi:hypothetical protein